MTDNPFAAALANSELKLIGRQVLHYRQVGSTNLLLRDMAGQGAEEGLVIVADEQTAGRGRLGRRWISPPEASLMLSLLLRPDGIMPFACTMLAGVALCEAIEQLYPVKAALKWPNDLLLPADGHLRKAAGMLSEMVSEGSTLTWLVLGIGINLSWQPEGIIDGRNLAESATCLQRAAGVAIDRIALFRAYIEHLDLGYAALRSGKQDALFQAWRLRLATLGQHVRIMQGEREIAGIAESVDPSGALMLRDSSGKMQMVVAGDVEA